MDVKIAFFNGFLQEEVYLEQPQGFDVYERDSHVCRLKKAFYGLKQAPRAWYSRIDSYLLSIGFQKSEADPNLYYIVVGGVPLILLLYVDDLLLVVFHLLLYDVWQEDGHAFLGQGKYVADVLKRFQMEDCRPMSTPMITN